MGNPADRNPADQNPPDQTPSKHEPVTDDPNIRDMGNHGTRERIAQIASMLFQTEGYNRVSEHDIAFHSSVSEATVRYYYPDMLTLARLLSHQVMMACVQVVGDAGRIPVTASAAPTGDTAARVEFGSVLRIGQLFFNAMRSDRLFPFARDTMAFDGAIAFDARWVVSHLPHFHASEDIVDALERSLRAVRLRVSADLLGRCSVPARRRMAYDGLDMTMLDLLIGLGTTAEDAEAYVRPALLAETDLAPLTHRAVAMLA